MEDGETEHCYLCHGPASAENPFAIDPKPCQCTGSIVLHKACLQQLMSRSASCSICKGTYNLLWLATEDGYVVKYIHHHKIKYKINAAGQKHGPFEIWYWTAQGQFLNQIKQRCTYVADKREGLDEQWYANGNRWHRYSVVADKREGLYEAWYMNGHLWVRCNYRDGKLEGLYESFYKNGQVLHKYNLVDGKREGLYVSWHENGVLASRCNYVGGEMEGIYEEWDETCQLKSRSYYVCGKKMTPWVLNTRESDRAFDAWFRGLNTL